MMSPRRSAQLGLGGACLILVSSVAVLVAGGSDANRDLSSGAASVPSATIATAVSNTTSASALSVTTAALKQ